jgi:hypothetical protein
VKGEHGGIEVVTAVDVDGVIRGIAIQSQREPEPIAREITAANWLGAFAGRDAKSSFRLGQDLPDVAVPARVSAQAIAEGVRSLLVLLAVAEGAREKGHPHP